MGSYALQYRRLYAHGVALVEVTILCESEEAARQVADDLGCEFTGEVFAEFDAMLEEEKHGS